MTKSWITKKQLDELVKSYSFKKKEFRLTYNKDIYWYLPNDPNSHISLTVSQWKNENPDKPDGVKVTLTENDGYISFIDYYRLIDGKYNLIFRSIPKNPVSDELQEAKEYIKYLNEKLYDCSQKNYKLEEQIDSLKQENKRLSMVSHTKKGASADECHKLISDIPADKCHKLISDIPADKCHKLNSGTSVKNERGAGRHKSAERADSLNQMRNMLNEGKSLESIISELNISRRTYFRYLKDIKNIQ